MELSQKNTFTFVLGGGGARGALQVGALRALLEAGYVPGMMVGVSIGAVNAAFLAMHGFSQDSLENLTEAWREASTADLLPANYLWLTVRSLFGRPSAYPAHRLRDYFVAHGLNPDLRFKDIQGVRLIIVAADLNSGQPVLYGMNPEDSLLEAVLASTTLPPWIQPMERNGQYLVDGGMVSNLPIEPAIAAGASEIFALDLIEHRQHSLHGPGFGPFFGKLVYAIEKRQEDLELALAAARGIPVTHIPLHGVEPVALWDFLHNDTLIQQGYEITHKILAGKQPVPGKEGWFARLRRSFLGRKK